MTISVRLEPQIEARLLAQARAKGVPLEVYVQTVIAQAAAAESRPSVSSEEFDAALDALAEESEHLPVLPPKAYRRESIYGDE